MADQFQMMGPEELVKGGKGNEFVAAVGQRAGIAGKAAGMAGDIGDRRHGGRRQRLGLGTGSGPRRVEHHGIEAGEFAGIERRTLEIAPGRLAGVPLGGHGGLAGGGNHGSDTFEGLDAPLRAERKAQQAAAGEQVGDRAAGRQDGIQACADGGKNWRANSAARSGLSVIPDAKSATSGASPSGAHSNCFQCRRGSARSLALSIWVRETK